MDDVFKKIGSDFTLSQLIEQKVESAIREKKFRPGQKLPSEQELCSLFGVSRTVVREALRMLSARGLIDVKKGSGIFVNDFSTLHASGPMSLYLELNFDEDYILHVVNVRKMVEPPVARTAASKRTDAHIKLLEKNLLDLKQCDPMDTMREAEIDLEFHSLIAKASGNPIITVILQPLFSLMPKIKSLVIANVENAKKAAEEYHGKIVEQIVERNPQGAFDAMTEHLKIAEEHSLKFLKAIAKSKAA